MLLQYLLPPPQVCTGAPKSLSVWAVGRPPPPPPYRWDGPTPRPLGFPIFPETAVLKPKYSFGTEGLFSCVVLWCWGGDPPLPTRHSRTPPPRPRLVGDLFSLALSWASVGAVPAGGRRPHRRMGRGAEGLAPPPPTAGTDGCDGQRPGGKRCTGGGHRAVPVRLSVYWVAAVVNEAPQPTQGGRKGTQRRGFLQLVEPVFHP